MIDTDIKNRFEALDKVYIEFIGSDSITELAPTFGKSLGFDSYKINILSNGIFLYLMFFIKFDKFVDFIASECGLEKSEASSLANGILLCLPEDFYRFQENMVTEFYNKETADLKGNPGDGSHYSPSNIRTMAEDMVKSTETEEVVYSSTQAAILNEAKPKDESADRWGSENK